MISTPLTCHADRIRRTGSGPPRPFLDDEDLGTKLRAYLDCRSRRVDPPAHLVEAWDGFYRRHMPKLRAYLRRFGLPEAEREDCLQEIWAKILARPGLLPEDPRGFRMASWFRSVARNGAIDAIRRRKRTATWERLDLGLQDDAPGPAEACDILSARTRVTAVLASLAARSPELSYRVFHLRAIDGLTNREVALALGLTPDQVRFRLHRMMAKFRDLYSRRRPFE